MENKDNKKRILVVDDNDNLRSILIDKLNLSGFEAVGARDGEEGLKEALSSHPDVILLDIIMPKMGGQEMLAKLREDEWGKEAKVMILTVLEDADSIAEAMGKGTFVYLIKTEHNLEDVVRQVEETLKNKSE